MSEPTKSRWFRRWNLLLYFIFVNFGRIKLVYDNVDISHIVIFCDFHSHTHNFNLHSPIYKINEFLLYLINKNSHFLHHVCVFRYRGVYMHNYILFNDVQTTCILSDKLPTNHCG